MYHIRYSRHPQPLSLRRRSTRIRLLFRSPRADRDAYDDRSDRPSPCIPPHLPHSLPLFLFWERSPRSGHLPRGDLPAAYFPSPNRPVFHFLSELTPCSVSPLHAFLSSYKYHGTGSGESGVRSHMTGDTTNIQASFPMSMHFLRDSALSSRNSAHLFSSIKGR